MTEGLRLAKEQADKTGVSPIVFTSGKKSKSFKGLEDFGTSTDGTYYLLTGAKYQELLQKANKK